MDTNPSSGRRTSKGIEWIAGDLPFGVLTTACILELKHYFSIEDIKAIRRCAKALRRHVNALFDMNICQYEVVGSCSDMNVCQFEVVGNRSDMNDFHFEVVRSRSEMNVCQFEVVGNNFL